MLGITRRSIVEVLVGAVLAALCLFFWMPRKAPATPLTFAPVRDWVGLSSPPDARPGGKAPVVIVAFSDFQCPYCRQLDGALTQVAKESPNVSVVFRHHPLSAIHPFAMPAAVAAECARVQGRFDEYRAALFANQALVGKTTWVAFAAEAGVADTEKFDVCTRTDGSVLARIARDIEASQTIQTRGTPAVVVNGRELSRPPSLDELRSLVAQYQGRNGSSNAPR